MRRIAHTAGLLLAVASLAGCAAAAAQSGSPTTTAATASDVGPSPESTKGTVEIGTRNTVVMDEDGTVLATAPTTRIRSRP